MGKGHRTDAKAAWAGAEKACYSVGKRGSAEKTGFQSTETALMAADRQKGARPPRFQVPCFNTTDPRFRGEEEKLLFLGFPDAFLKTSEDADWDGSGERWEPFRAGDPAENARTGHSKVGDALPGLPPSSASQCNRHAPSFCCAAERAAPKAARGH